MNNSYCNNNSYYDISGVASRKTALRPVKIRWKMPMNIHCKMPLKIHDDF